MTATRCVEFFSRLRLHEIRFYVLHTSTSALSRLKLVECVYVSFFVCFATSNPQLDRQIRWLTIDLSDGQNCNPNWVINFHSCSVLSKCLGWLKFYFCFVVFDITIFNAQLAFASPPCKQRFTQFHAYFLSHELPLENFQFGKRWEKFFIDSGREWHH